MGKDEDEHFVRVELPAALRAIYARASIDKTLAGKLLFDQLAYVRPDASKESSHADVLKALAFCFKAVNANGHDDPAAARRILEKLERAQEIDLAAAWFLLSCGRRRGGAHEREHC